MSKTHYQHFIFQKAGKENHLPIFEKKKTKGKIPSYTLSKKKKKKRKNKNKKGNILTAFVIQS